MDKNVKNVLAAVGAIAVVKTAPVLALGAAIGAVATNPEKVKKVAEELAGRVEAGLARYGADISAEAECECCKGGPCTCEGECACDSAEEPEMNFEYASAPMEVVEPENCEEEISDVETAEDVSAEETKAPTEEPKAENTHAAEGSLEDLRTKAKEFLDAAMAFAHEAVNDMK